MSRFGSCLGRYDRCNRLSKAVVNNMPKCGATLLVVILAVGISAAAAGQTRGSGGAVRPAPAPAPAPPRGRSAGPGSAPGAVGGPTREFRSQLVFRPDRSNLGRTPFIWGYGYWFPYWFDEWIPNGPVAVAEPPPFVPLDLPTGGLQLDVEPRRAKVYVDGFYAGIVDNFTGYYHHLELPAGSHRIEIFENGYEPHIFGVVIAPGQTTTYRATLGWTTKGQR